IGSLSVPIKATRIDTMGGAIISSKFYGYGTSYYVADSIKPGSGYWVKCSHAGKLVLNAASTANNPVSTSTEQPPDGPPSAPDATYLSTPDNLATGLHSPVALTW